MSCLLSPYSPSVGIKSQSKNRDGSRCSKARPNIYYHTGVASICNIKMAVVSVLNCDRVVAWSVFDFLWRAFA